MSAAAALAPAPPSIRAANRRLMLVTATLDAPAGEETQAAELAAYMSARGWQVTVASMTPPSRLPRPLAETAISPLSLGIHPANIDPRAVLKLRALVRARRPHVLHAHSAQAGILARAVRLIQPLPVVICTVPGSCGSENRARGSRRLALRLMERLSDLNAAADAGNLSVVPGVDTERFRPDPAARRRVRQSLGVTGEFVWLAAGPLNAAGEHCTLIDAFALVHARHPDHLLWLAAGGPLRAAIQPRLREAGLLGRVRFLENSYAIHEWLAAADACVVPARLAGTPLALLEASAAGLPVIAARTAGCAAAVRDGRTGILVLSGNEVVLAQAMTRIANLAPAERAWMGLSGREHVRARYALAAVMSAWERIYEQRLSRNVARL